MKQQGWRNIDFEPQSNRVSFAVWYLTWLLPTIDVEELFNQLLITMDAIAETEPNVHSIINV